MTRRTKIILDADVIIHFAKGNMLSLLPAIFGGYDYVVLDMVYHEVKEPLKSQLDQQIDTLQNISMQAFAPTGEVLREFALLSRTLGRGESACMVYCRHHHAAIGSSNLRDIKNYCQEHGIAYITTLDFVYHAVAKQLLSVDQANAFVDEVKQKGSRLPDVDFRTFVSPVRL